MFTSAKSPVRLFLLLSILPGFFSPSMLLAADVPSTVLKLLNKYRIPLTDISVDIRDIKTSQPILQLNAQRPRNPASAIKILTTLAALEILGPQFTWKTHYYFQGTLKNGVLDGDIIMQGGGDPFLVQEKFWYHVQSLRQRGIHTITGDLVIDNFNFDLPKHSRSAFDQAPYRLYNVGPDSTLVNFSANRFVIQPSNGDIRVFAEPPLYGLKIDNQLRPGTKKCTSPKAGWGYHLEQKNSEIIARFSGNYHIGCGQYSIGRAIFSNQEYTYRLFKQLWLDSGGRFTGKYRLSPTPEQATLLVSHSSKPLAEVVRDINKYSNNVMSRQLFLSLNFLNDASPIPARLMDSRRKVTNWLTVNNIKIPGFYIDNGSGLSRKTRITASGLAQLLQQGWRSDYAAEFLSSFSLIGLDGTMRERLTENEIKGRARIKTGALNGVRSMVGYVRAQNHKYYSISMIIASPKVTFWNGNIIQDALLKWLYSF